MEGRSFGPGEAQARGRRINAALVCKPQERKRTTSVILLLSRYDYLNGFRNTVPPGSLPAKSVSSSPQTHISYLQLLPCRLKWGALFTEIMFLER